MACYLKFGLSATDYAKGIPSGKSVVKKSFRPTALKSKINENK